MKNFRTYNLALQLYKMGQQCQIKSPIVRDQFDRATLSIVLNLAEGEGKQTLKDRRKFYTIAMGSLRETEACIDIIENKALKNQANIVGAHLYKLIQHTQPQNSPRHA